MGNSSTTHSMRARTLLKLMETIRRLISTSALIIMADRCLRQSTRLPKLVRSCSPSSITNNDILKSFLLQKQLFFLAEINWIWFMLSKSFFKSFRILTKYFYHLLRPIDLQLFIFYSIFCFSLSLHSPSLSGSFECLCLLLFSSSSKWLYFLVSCSLFGVKDPVSFSSFSLL